MICDGAFDDDYFDALIMVERVGCARFCEVDLAATLGISTKSIWHFQHKGVIEEPYQPKPPMWTPEQVARALLARGMVGT